MKLVPSTKDSTHYTNEDVHLLSKLYGADISEQYGQTLSAIKKWILSNFDDNYFGDSIYIDQEMIHRKLKKKGQRKLLKLKNPQLGIFPKYDFDHNRDTVDLYQWGINKLMLTKDDRSFIRDKETKNSIGLDFEEMKIDFDLRIKLSSKIEQINLAKRLKSSMRVSMSEDIQEKGKVSIPYQILNDMYRDYFNEDIIRSDINSINKAIKYFNDRSKITIQYELNKSSGEYNFYMLVDNITYRIKVDSISIDDGYQEGDTYSNFMIDISFTSYNTSISRFYRIYSDKSNITKFYITDTEIENNVTETITNEIYNKIEEPEFISDNFSLYQESEVNGVELGDLEITYEDLLTNIGVGDLIPVFNKCIENRISPNRFIKFIVKSNNDPLEIINDFENGIMTIKNIPSSNLFIYCYLDSVYVKSLKIMQDGD